MAISYSNRNDDRRNYDRLPQYYPERVSRGSSRQQPHRQVPVYEAGNENYHPYPSHGYGGYQERYEPSAPQNPGGPYELEGSQYYGSMDGVLHGSSQNPGGPYELEGSQYYGSMDGVLHGSSQNPHTFHVNYGQQDGDIGNNGPSRPDRNRANPQVDYPPSPALSSSTCGYVSSPNSMRGVPTPLRRPVDPRPQWRQGQVFSQEQLDRFSRMRPQMPGDLSQNFAPQEPNFDYRSDEDARDPRNFSPEHIKQRWRGRGY